MLSRSSIYKFLRTINTNVSRYALIYYAVAFILLLIVGSQSYVSIEYLTRDATIVSGGKFYAGLFSNVGLFIWCSTAVVNLFGFTLLKKQGSKLNRSFLLFASLISFVLFLDDFLLLHELIFPRYLGISENFFVLLYPLMLLSFTVYFARIIISTQVVVYTSALFFLALSMGLDKIVPQISSLSYLFEDGFKLLGITGWCSYFSHTSIVMVRQGLAMDVAAAPAVPQLTSLPAFDKVTAINTCENKETA
jgi:hypothetical protein